MTKQLIEDFVVKIQLGTTMLRPTRQASKNAVLNVMDRNEVVLELIKLKKINNSLWKHLS